MLRPHIYAFCACLGITVEQLAAMYQVPVYLIVGTQPRQHGNPEVFHNTPAPITDDMLALEPYLRQAFAARRAGHKTAATKREASATASEALSIALWP